VRLLTGVVVALALVLVPSTAFAQAPELPVGEAHGVRVVRQDKAIVVVLSARLHERLAGKKVIVSCTTLLEDGANIGSQAMRVPLRGRRLLTGDVTPKIDYCRVLLPPRERRPKRVLVSVPLTQKGAVFLDEESKTLRMLTILVITGFAQEKQKLDGYPTYDQLVNGLPKRARAPFSKRVVPLGAPTDTPPAKTVGYYSDGAQQIAVSIVSASGRLLFIRYGPDDVLTTNVVGYMFGTRE
jgi:hypothetical protein